MKILKFELIKLENVRNLQGLWWGSVTLIRKLTNQSISKSKQIPKHMNKGVIPYSQVLIYAIVIELKRMHYMVVRIIM